MRSDNVHRLAQHPKQVVLFRVRARTTSCARMPLRSTGTEIVVALPSEPVSSLRTLRMINRREPVIVETQQIFARLACSSSLLVHPVFPSAKVEIGVWPEPERDILCAGAGAAEGEAKSSRSQSVFPLLAVGLGAGAGA
ncbi:hypothetical protein NLJ89_g12081 [Agrocybe chaxingu]|uniref:Uncharacterized protein n=1 Tax=Agrocybe chaxingu TaxID=84603 RepID=A0A9W8JN53_9AGAR|nr:hypothetical protein NLJ89_g12081 [Agrocybe chaxingu]